MKKPLLILIIVIIFIAVFFGAWWFLMRDSGTPTTDTTGQTTKTFNPFGIFGGNDTPSSPTPQEEGTFPDSSSGNGTLQQAIVEISDKPVAGVTTLVLHIGTSTEELVRYVQRETGHIYDYKIATGVTTRISNTTIPRVREALFGNNAATVAFRRIQDDGETIETFLGNIAPMVASTSNESRLSGVFLPQNILAVAMHPTQDQVFYEMRSDSGGAGYVVSPSGTKTIFAHPFYQWQASWNTGSYILLSTAPSRSVGGIAFSLDPVSGALTRMGTTTVALTTLPNIHGDTILYGSVGQSGPRIFTYNPKTKQSTALSIATLPEKCVWANATLLYCAIPNNSTQNLPDDWYQGVVSFTDTLWQIDTATGLTTYIIDPGTILKNGADMTHLALSDDGADLTFINKKDGTLWLVDLSRALAAPRGSSNGEGGY
jgi:hypothetical protein